jgi:thermitase
MNYAVNKGVKISNNSWGGGGPSKALLDAINRADTAGHLFVAAAGDEGVNNDTTPHYPSSYNSANIISVAATDNKDTLASFSNYGSSSVDLAAPGVGILSTLHGRTYDSYSGTSMATPHVTGAALLKSENSNIDDVGLKTRLLDYTDKKASLSGKMVTGSRLNAAQTLGAPMVESTTPASVATGVPRNTPVSVTFTEELKSETIDTSTVELYQKYWYQVRKKKGKKIRWVWTFRWEPVNVQ